MMMTAQRFRTTARRVARTRVCIHTQHRHAPHTHTTLPHPPRPDLDGRGDEEPAARLEKDDAPDPRREAVEEAADWTEVEDARARGLGRREAERAEPELRLAHLQAIVGRRHGDAVYVV